VFTIFSIFIVALSLSTAVTWLVCELALRFRWVPAPVADRLPVSPAPILGGAAIYLAFVSSAVITNLFRTPTEIVLFTASSAAFLLGLIVGMIAVLTVIYGVTSLASGCRLTRPLSNMPRWPGITGLLLAGRW
jgi:UDP-N-acetylmuramyl pentapeptide phosphotransferase/UDP-N-acetylglucosamine-1-phosphate transferase